MNPIAPVLFFKKISSMVGPTTLTFYLFIFTSSNGGPLFLFLIFDFFKWCRAVGPSLEEIKKSKNKNRAGGSTKISQTWFLDFFFGGECSNGGPIL